MTDFNVAAEAAMAEFFPAFLRWGFSVLRPGERLVDAPYLQVTAHALARLADGDFRRLLLTLPPRHLKSITTSVLYPAWLLGRDPSRKFIVVSYSEELARDLSRMFRQVIEHPEYREAFPGTHFRHVTDTDVSTTATGRRYGVSVNGSITGLGADIIICDDLMRPEDAHSSQLREATLRRFDGTVSTRLNMPQDGAIIIVQQRLHDDDLAAHVLARGGYDHLNFPLVATAQARFRLGRGGSWTRVVGDVLSPERFGPDTIAQLRQDLGEPAFEAQYQQNPVPPGGGRFNLARVAYYDPDPDQPSSGDWPPSADTLDRTVYPQVVQAWDVASGTGPQHDYSVCTTWGYHGLSACWHLLDLWRAQRDFVDVRLMAVQLWRQWNAEVVIVEGNGVGRPLFQELNRVSRDHFFYDPVREPKDVRFESNIHRLYTNANEAALPRSAPWLETLLAELSAFPRGRHDDQVDSVVLFLTWLARGHGEHLIERANRPPVSNRLIGVQRRRPLNDPLTMLQRNGRSW